MLNHKCLGFEHFDPSSASTVEGTAATGKGRKDGESLVYTMAILTTDLRKATWEDEEEEKLRVPL